MGSKRARHWTFIVYPDSVVNPNWKEIIKATHIKLAISPLHDKDLNPTGDEKKPHWHVMVEYDSLKSYEQVKEGARDLLGNGCTIPQIVQSPVGLIRYFIHKDNPEKYQYEWKDIIVYNGFDLSKYDTYTEGELDRIFAEIEKFIDDNDITEYSDLTAALRNPEGDLFDWYRIVRKNTVFFNACIGSRRNKLKEWKKQQQEQMRNIQKNKKK